MLPLEQIPIHADQYFARARIEGETHWGARFSEKIMLGATRLQVWPATLTKKHFAWTNARLTKRLGL